MDTVAIGRGTFDGNTEITSVVIPEGVTTIEGIAFMGCTNLETVVFPNTLMEIGLYAFADCDSLKDIWFNSSITEELANGNFSEQAFVGVSDDVVVHLPASLTEEQQTAMKDSLFACGLPETAAFETYSLR